MGRLAKFFASLIVVATAATFASAGPVGANSVPVAAGINDVYGIDVGSPVVINLATAFSDPDADDLTFSLIANTDATFVTAAIDNDLDRATMTRAAGTVGSAVVTVEASDGVETTQTSFRVTDADHVWTGLGSNNNWNNGDNWVPYGIPWSEDVALMDSGSKNVLITTNNLTISGLRVTSGYSGTIDLNGRSLTAFADVDLAGANLIANGLTISVHGDLDLSGATVNVTGSTMRLKGDVDLDGAVLTATGSTIELLSTRAVTVSGPSTPIGNLIVDTGQIVTLATDLEVSGRLTLKTVETLDGAVLLAAGDVVAKDILYNGSATLEIMGAGPQTVTASNNNASLSNVRIAKPSGTATFVGNFRVSGSFVHAAGDVDLSGTRVSFAGGMSHISAPAIVFDDVELIANFSSPVTGDMQINGDLTIGSVADSGASGTGYMNVRGDVTSSDKYVGSTVGIRFIGSQNQTISAPSNELTDGDLVVDKSEGSVVLATELTRSDGQQRLRVVSGTFDANNQFLLARMGVIVEGGTLTGLVSTGQAGSGDGLTVTSGTIRLRPAVTASVSIEGPLFIGPDDSILEVDLAGAEAGSYADLLLASGSRSGEFGEIVVVNNSAGFIVTSVYGSNNAGVVLAVPNDAPTVADGLPDQFGLRAGLTLTLAGVFDDGDDDPLTYSLIANSNSDFVSASVTGSQLLITPVAGEVGSSEITVRATDPAGEWSETSFRATDADHVWTGGAPNGDWNDPLNWAPQETPGQADVVVLDSGSKNIDVNDDWTVQSLRVEPGYSGSVVVASTKNLTVLGLLSHRSGVIDMRGASVSLGGVGEFLADGVLTAGSTLIVRSGASLELGGIEWHDVHLQRQGDAESIAIDGDLVVGGSLTVTGAVTVTGGSPSPSIRIAGNVTGILAVLSGTTPIMFDGAGDQLISGGVGVLGADGRLLVIEKPSGTLSLDTGLQVHDLTLVSGTFDLGGNTLAASGSLDLSGGTLVAVGSLIELTDDATAAPVSFDPPSTPINDLRIDSANTITLANDVEVDGALTLTRVDQLDGSTLRAGGDVHTGDASYLGTATLAFVADGDQTVSAASAVSSLRNVRIDKPSGTIDFANSLHVHGRFAHVGGAAIFGDPSAIDQTVTFTGPSHAIDAAAVTFDHVVFGGDFAGEITGALRVSGEFVIAEMTGPTTAGTDGQIIALGNVISSDHVVDSLVPIRFSGGADQSVSGSDLTDADLIIDKSAGTVLLIDPLEVNGPGQGVVVVAGTLDTGGNTVDADGGIWVDGGLLQGGGSILGQSGLTLNGGALAIDPDDPATAFQVEGPIVLGGSLQLDLSGVLAGSYLNLLTSEGNRIGTFAAIEVSNNDDGLVVNERYDAARAGVALGDPIAGQIGDLVIELPAVATSVDLEAAFDRTDLTFAARSDQTFVIATIDPTTPGALDLTFSAATVGTAVVAVDASSTDSGTESTSFKVTLLDTTDPQITIAEPLADARFAHDGTIAVTFGCDDLDGTTIVSCAGAIDGSAVDSGSAAPPLDPGDHTLVVTSTDAADNIATSTRLFTVLAPLTADLADRQFELAATTTTIDLADAFGEEGLTYQVSIDQSFVSSTVTDDVLELLYSPATIGTATVTISALSPSGAHGGATFTVSLTDTAAPAITFAAPVDNAAFAHDDPVSIGFSCAAGAGTPVTRCAATIEGVAAGAVVATNGMTLVTLVPGSYQLAVTAADAAGNEQTLRHTFTVLAELTASIEPLMLSLPAEAVAIDLADAFGRSGLIFVATSDKTFVDAAIDGEQLTISFTPGAIGSAVVRVSAAGSDGARGSLTIAISLVDGDDPAITVASPARDTYAFGESIAIRFACDDLGGTPIVSCLGRLDGATVPIGSRTSELDSGSHELVVQAGDAAGNSSTVVVPFEVAEPLRQSPLIGTEFEGSRDLRATVARLYVATFNRAPDPAGHAYWQARVDSGMSLMELTVLLVRSPEYRSIYDTPDNADFVEHVYRNVLRRPADPAGKAYWVAQLSDDFDRAHLVLLVAESAESRRFSNTN